MICKLRNPLTLALLHTVNDVLTAHANYMLNAIGNASFTIALSSPHAAFIVEELVADLSTDDGMQLGVFIIKSITDTISANSKILTVSGPTLDSELDYFNVGDNVISEGASANSSDITDLMAYAPSWSVVFEGPHLGTAVGTNLVGAGETVLEMLRQAQAQSGEYFALNRLTAERSIYWFRRSESNMQRFFLQPDMTADEQDFFAAPITKISKSTRSADIVTRIWANGAGLGSDEIMIDKISPALRAQLVAAWPDYTINFDTSFIINHKLETTHPEVTRPLKFGNIRPASDSEADLEAASLSLFNAAMYWLEERKAPTIQYTIDILPKRFTTLLPGSTFEIDYDDGITVIQKDLVLLESHISVTADGIAKASCVMSEEITSVLDDSMFIASKFSATDATLRHATAPSTGSTSTIPVQHHNLLGLADDDHPKYLPVDGSRPITGQVPMNPSATIDGMDPSAHMNAQNAHHNWPLGDADIPASIARDAEVTAAFDTVTALLDLHEDTENAHHNWPLTDIDIPTGITRDSELYDAISLHTQNPNAHHSKIHGITSSDHTVTGSKWQLLGLVDTDALGLLTPSTQPGSSERLLKTDATGQLHLTRFKADAITGHLIAEHSDSLNIGDPTKLWKEAWISELNAVLFVENTVSAIGGSFIIPHGQGTLVEDLLGTDTSIDFGKVMDVGDIILLRGNLKVEYMKIGTLVSGTHYHVSRDLDATGANDWPAGHVYIVLGSDGDGRIEMDAQTAGPRISVLKQGLAYNSASEQLRIGDLAGWGAYSDYGIGIGDPLGAHLVGKLGSLTLATSPTGKRIEFGATGIVGIDSNGITQFSADSSTGKLIAGAGSVTIDANGISIDDVSTASETLTFRKGSTVIGVINGTYDGSATNTMKISMRPASGYGNQTKIELVSDGDLPGNKVGLHLRGTSGSVFAGDRAWLDIGGSLWRFGIDSTSPYQKYFTAPSNARLNIQDVYATNVFGTAGAISGLVVGQENSIYAVDEQIRLYRGTTWMGQISTSDTTWTRWNQDVAKNIYTPRAMAIGTSLIVGTSTIQSAGVIAATSDGRFGGGISSGSYTSNPGTGNLLYTGAIRKVYSGTTYTCASPPILVGPDWWYNAFYNQTRTSANNGLLTLPNVPAGVKYVYVKLDANPSVAGSWVGCGPHVNIMEHLIEYSGRSGHAGGMCRTNGTNQLYMYYNGTSWNVSLWITGYGF